MLNPNDITVGRTYRVRIGLQQYNFFVNRIENRNSESWLWHGTVKERGRFHRIRLPERFIEEVNEEGSPWFLTLHFDDEYTFGNEIGKLETFWISIRESGTQDLIAHIGQTSTDDLSECAKILCRTMNICRKSAPSGTDLTRIHLWNNGEDVDGYEFGVVPLQFDNWDPAFATQEFISEFLKRTYEEADRIEDGIADQAGD